MNIHFYNIHEHQSYQTSAIAIKFLCNNSYVFQKHVLVEVFALGLNLVRCITFNTDTQYLIIVNIKIFNSHKCTHDYSKVVREHNTNYKFESLIYKIEQIMLI